MLVPLAEYQALVDAADAAPFAPDLLREIVDHLRQHLEADEPGVDLDEFLAAYDARHGDAGYPRARGVPAGASGPRATPTARHPSHHTVSAW